MISLYEWLRRDFKLTTATVDGALLILDGAIETRQFETLTKTLSAPNSSIFASIASISVARPLSASFGSMTITFSPIDSIDFKHDFWSMRGQITLFA